MPASSAVLNLPAVPNMSEIRDVIPEDCFESSLATSMRHAVVSVALTVGTGVLAALFLPMTWAWLPVWLLYAVVCGTFACGVWVVAHECGHGAFTKHGKVQDTVGFVLHSALLVPYFSWQRSHGVHHAKTNHLNQGETHVPKAANSDAGVRAVATRRRLGDRAHTAFTVGSRLLVGWPAYLVAGATGGTSRGVTNHFWPFAPFETDLFPARWRAKVLASAVGVLAVVGLLAGWAVAAGSLVPVLALYVGPYLVCNAWLVAYTWLQHTNADIPHYDDEEWNYVRGAFCSVDRPYGPVFDFLHHRIGSTHVAHHLYFKIPHYKAKVATDAIASAYPHLYRYDPTPVHKALWRAGRDCLVVTPTSDGWRFVDEDATKRAA